MPFSNYHTHCNFCDGRGTPRQIVEQAVALGMKSIGFSSHAPLPFPASWTLTVANLPIYCKEIIELKEQYRGRIEVFLGLEIDYIPGRTGPNYPHFNNLGLDYRIGSVHFVGRFADGKHCAVDSRNSFPKGLSEIYQGDIRRLIEDYYALVRRMVRTDCPDILAHLDVFKLNNGNGGEFSEDEPWYRQVVVQTLDVVAESGVILEVNLGGINKGLIDAPYPSEWIIALCFERGIPVTISSDAHRPEHLTSGFSEAARALLDIGYREIMVLDENGWRPCSFTSEVLDW